MTDLQTGPVAATHASDRTKLLWAGGTVFDVVLGGAETAGALALLDQVAAGGDATPMHVHHTDAEVFYVLDGSVTAWAGDDVVELSTGSAVYLPPRLKHAIHVTSDTARILTLTAPAGFAEFVREAGVPLEGEQPATWEFDVGRIMAAAPKHGIEIVGPPPPLPTR